MSLRFQADNDLKFAIVKAVRKREPSIDFLSAWESQLDGVGDPELLQRTAENGRERTRAASGTARKRLVSQLLCIGHRPQQYQGLNDLANWRALGNDQQA